MIKFILPSVTQTGATAKNVGIAYVVGPVGGRGCEYFRCSHTTSKQPSISALGVPTCVLLFKGHGLVATYWYPNVTRHNWDAFGY
jgi:hypothetical protein